MDLKSRKKASLKASRAKKTSKGKKTPSFKVKEIKAPALATTQVDAELEHYFPSAPVEVTTCLHIPLAPTPTERSPLRESTRRAGSFLPLPELATIHTMHNMHSTRVSSMFSRLDAAAVWDKGVSCSAYSQFGQGEGLCTILKVEFVGWTAAEVRSVIGESGTGWCALEEVQGAIDTSNMRSHEEDSDSSETSSILSGLTADDSFVAPTEPPPYIDPSSSFVLPTLDFSSSFVNTIRSTPSTPPVVSRSFSDQSLSGSDFDYFSDSSEDSGVDVRPHMQFSAEFLRRSHEVQEPMENIF